MHHPLSDAEELELHALCTELADGRLTKAGQDRLNAMLKSSQAARELYLRASALSASLFSYAAEMQSEAPPPMPVQKRMLPRVVSWAVAIPAAAAVVLTGAWLLLRHQPQANARDITSLAADSTPVALMTGTKDCQWSGTTVLAGAVLQAGQRLELTKGVAEITFDSGAQVTLDGPASLVVASAWDASLESGAMQAHVPAEAAGFRVSHPSVEVVDQGAEYSMIAETASADVLVYKGQVEAAAPRGASITPVLLHEKESRRFAPEGTSDVRDRERKFARFAKVLTLDRSRSAGGYAHWSFDQSEGALLKAEAKGRKKKASLHAKLVASGDEAVSAATLTDGRWGRALSFDGRLYARATVPGIASPAVPRTLAFWVRVPADAPLGGDSASFLGWGEHNRKHGVPVRIGWNKFPAQGPVGALRTDFGHGLTMGSTSLRDGRWHHIAVVLTPDGSNTLRTRQYVDGRLEGAAHHVRIRPPAENSRSEAVDTLMLGHSPGDKAKAGFFKGSLDELFVFDRALSPAEIVRLMHENQPPEIVLAEAF